MIKKIVKKINEKIENVSKTFITMSLKIKAIATLALALYLTNFSGLVANAAGINVDQVVYPVKVIGTILIAIVAIVGVIVLILGIVDLVSAIPSGDTGGIKTGAFKLGAGGLLAAISVVLTLMGYTI